MGALRCGHATLQRKGSLGAVQHVQICSLSQILDDEFEARQVIERMDGNKAEAEAQDIHLDIRLFDNLAAFKETVAWHGPGQTGLQSLRVCRACPQTFAKCSLP